MAASRNSLYIRGFDTVYVWVPSYTFNIRCIVIAATENIQHIYIYIYIYIYVHIYLNSKLAVCWWKGYISTQWTLLLGETKPSRFLMRDPWHKHFYVMSCYIALHLFVHLLIPQRRFTLIVRIAWVCLCWHQQANLCQIFLLKTGLPSISSPSCMYFHGTQREIDYNGKRCKRMMRWIFLHTKIVLPLGLEHRGFF